MTNSLLFEFTVDKAAKTVYINREFDAELSLVWDAFTKQDLLDQWIEPKPWHLKRNTWILKLVAKDFTQW